MEAFTGLNIGKVDYDFENLAHEFSDLFYAYEGTMNHLFDALNTYWASPKAVEFSNTFIPKIKGLIGNVEKEFLHIQEGAINAASHIASANGLCYAHGLYYFNMIDIERVTACKESLDGQVGMDIEKVEDALNTYSGECQTVLERIDSLPEGIAFYDPEGKMVGAYNKNIKDMKVKFTDLFDGITSAINNAITTESATIFAAKQKATETLNS